MSRAVLVALVAVLLVSSAAAAVTGARGTATQSSPAVVSSSVEHVGGTEPEMENVSLDVAFQNRHILKVSLFSEVRGYGFELANVGADRSTEFRITFVVENYDPRNLRGTANGLQWDREYRADGTVKVTILARPMAQQMMSGSPTFDDWPEGDADRADTAIEAKVGLLVRSFEGHADRLASAIDGTIVATDALTNGAADPDFCDRRRAVCGLTDRRDCLSDAIVCAGGLEEPSLDGVDRLPDRVPSLEHRPEISWTRTGDGVGGDFDCLAGVRCGRLDRRGGVGRVLASERVRVDLDGDVRDLLGVCGHVREFPRRPVEPKQIQAALSEGVDFVQPREASDEVPFDHRGTPLGARPSAHAVEALVGIAERARRRPVS